MGKWGGLGGADVYLIYIHVTTLGQYKLVFWPPRFLDASACNSDQKGISPGGLQASYNSSNLLIRQWVCRLTSG